MTHQWSWSIAKRFTRLLSEVNQKVDCFLLLHDDEGSVCQQWLQFLESIGAQTQLKRFSPKNLTMQLGYPYLNGLQMLPGSVHFPLLNFSRSYRYQYYWVIESDVEYRGNWLTFLNTYRECQAALLGAHIHCHRECPTYWWWNSLTLPSDIHLAVDDLHKAFLPICRLSADALDLIDEAHRLGWRGHQEVLIPTVLHLNGQAIQDFSQTAECYLGDSQNPCWSRTRLSTLRWRPEITLDEFINRGHGPLLFHPVKQDWVFDGRNVLQWRSNHG